MTVLMAKPPKEIMTKVIVRTDDVDGFFLRAKEGARRADQGQAFEGKVTLSFEDPQRKRLEAVASMPDEAIDYSDIPRQTGAVHWTRPGLLVPKNGTKLK